MTFSFGTIEVPIINEEKYVIIEKDFPFCTPDDIRNKAYEDEDVTEWFGGPYSILSKEEIINKKKQIKKGVVRSYRVLTEISRSLFSELKLEKEHNSIREILPKIEKVEVSKRNTEEKDELVYKLKTATIFSDWINAFGVYACLFDLEESYHLFSCFAKLFEKKRKGLYKAFSFVTTNKIGLSDESYKNLDRETKDSILMLSYDYKLIIWDGANKRWLPNRQRTPQGFTKILKDILEKDKALQNPEEYNKQKEIINKYEDLFLEEHRRVERLEFSRVAFHNYTQQPIEYESQAISEQYGGEEEIVSEEF